MVEGIRDEATIGFSKPDIRRQNSPEFYGIGRRRKNGGTIYALVMAAEMHRLQEAASRDALLVNIRQAEGLLGLEWVVLDSQEPPESPEFSWEWDRIDDTTAFVGIRTFRDADGTTAQLRMSIDASMIDEIKADAWRQGAIRVAFVGLLTLAVTAFFFARQNVGLLTSEKDRMQQEVRRLEEEARRKEKLTAMGELAAGVAHEIRNPLNAIGMVSQRLNREFEPRRTEDEAEFRELLDVLRSESARVENVIDQFLRFARPAKAEIVVGDLAQAVQDATKRASAFAASKNVSLIANAPGRCDYAFDPLQMAQVFDNLVRNAIEAQSDGGEVRLRLTSGEDGVTITVADKGQGIPPETLERIFDLYFTTKPNGNGLGLPIVHQIVAEHGGKIDIESEVGQGTTITITLPPTSES
ncbi:MAG: ATP-binding protein [Candidatus Poribacteria bacterium]|nr:ATP-binding protein [Candidatus Poribacteria bacterium]